MNKLNIISVALVQQEYAGTPEFQLKKTESNIRACARMGVRLVVLHEMHDTAYFCQSENMLNFRLAEAIPGPSTERYGRLAKELGLVLVISLFEKRASGLYHNTAVVIERNGDIAGIYRKMHIPDDPGYYEKYYFTPGDLGYRPLSTSLGKLGVMVCWDQWFPEAARLMALGGADMLIYPTSIGWNPDDEENRKEEELDAWISVQRGHAIANGLPVVAVNRVGYEQDFSGQTNGIRFWGNSFGCGAMGEMLGRSGQSDSILLVELDLKAGDDTRRQWPFLRDRRIDSYGNLKKRFIEY